MLVPSGATHNPDQKHLHIVCNDTCTLGLNLLVPVSTYYDGCDNTCTLNVGDHENVTHLSYIFYAKAKIVKAVKLQRGLEAQVLVPRPDLLGHVFDRVAAGVCISFDTPESARKYFCNG